MKPAFCFCKYDIDELIHIGRKKYLEKIPTVELMKEATSRKEKDEVCVISMLDIDDEKLEEVMANKVTDKKCNVISCRQMLREQIKKKLGIEMWHN